MMVVAGEDILTIYSFLLHCENAYLGMSNTNRILCILYLGI